MDFAAILVSDQLGLKPAVEIPTLCVAGSAISWHGIADARNLDIFISFLPVSFCLVIRGTISQVAGPLRQSSSVSDSFFFFSSSDHSSVQLLHLHSLYPAGLGEAGW